MVSCLIVATLVLTFCAPSVSEEEEVEWVIEDYDEAISLNPQFTEVYYSRSITHREQGKKAEATADFKKFIGLTDNPQWIEMARQQIDELYK